VVRVRRTVHEVPLLERALLRFHDQQRRPGKHEKILLIRLPVVHRHRVAGPEDDDVDPELREEGLALETAERRPAFRVVPARVLRAQDEPPVALRDAAGVGLFERSLGNHRPKL